MTPRPSLAAQNRQRPSSAIYIGSLTSISTPPELPRLPEPPSPGGSSNASDTGLPSPPATNSTGSVGDDTGTGSPRKRTSTATHRSSYSAPSIDMYGERVDLTHSKTHKKHNRTSNTNMTDDEDDPPYDNDYDHEADTTARFDSLGRSRSHTLTSAPPKQEEHNSALERVRSLTERNRMVLNKLSSIQRLGSPAPRKTSRSPPSPPDFASPTPHSRTSVSTSRISTSMYRDSPASYTPSHLRNRSSHNHSGSETERESRDSQAHPYAHHQHSSSDTTSITPTSVFLESNPLPSLPPTSDQDRQSVKHRRMSAPGSPGQNFRRQPRRDTSPTPTAGPSQSRSPRKRSSQSVSVERYADDEPEEEDVMAAALAAVASSRNGESIGPSVGRGKRLASRAGMPSAFRDGDDLQDDPVSATPHRNRDFISPGRSPSPSKRTASSNASVHDALAEQRSPRRREAATARNTSTVRELTRKHQTRWMSEDLTASQGNETPGTSRTRTSPSSYNNGLGRRQTGRHGSIDNALLSPSKRLVDEGFRATGIKKHDAGSAGDVFANGDIGSPPAQKQRTRSTGARSVVFGEDEWDSPVSSASISRPPDALFRPADPRTPSNILQRFNERQAMYQTPGSRPGTSMAALHHDSRTPRTAPLAVRTHRTGQDHQATSSAVTFEDSNPAAISAQLDRAFQTPSRLSGTPATRRQTNKEHRKIMLEALSMFESQLSRLPPMGQTTTTTIPDVFQHTQLLVHSLDKLNSLIRASAATALEFQIEADISDPNEAQAALVEVWTKIGSDEREKLRLSDEVVRTTTQFLLGVGKVLRDLSASAGSTAASSGAAVSHLRSGSMDEEAARRLVTSDASSDKRSSDGRQSRETRRSWDTREPTALKDKLANIGRISTPQSRPSSALHSLSRESGGSNESRSNGDPSEQTPPSRLSTALMSNSSSRRFYAPREKRTASDANPRNAALMSSIDSQETVHAHEPSPTPAGRQGISLGARSRALAPLAVPPSLSTLPSESLLDRASASPDSYSRRKVSTNSNLTVRAEASSLPSVIKPPGATTAVSTASADSPPSSSSLSRTHSRNSGGAATGVTFSRPSTLSALSGLQQHVNGHSYLSRTGSNGSVTETQNARDLISGSETERPRTVAGRGRASLDAPRPSILSTGGQSSTVNSIRRERRRTITEIFGSVNK